MFAIDDAVATTARDLIDRAQSDNAAYAIVASLTTEVGPRLAGTESEARARQWAVQKLRALGFANVREEAFQVPLWVRGEERARILSPFPQPLTITALGGSAGTGSAGVRGEVVTFASIGALKKVPSDSLAGKVVFVDEVMARSRDGSGYAAAVGKRRLAAYEAARAGASAALIRSVGTSSHRFAHTGQMRRVTEDGEAGVPTAALSAPDADQLQRALSYGGPVEVEVVITPRQLPPVPSGNIVAEIVGREVPEEIVLLGAHLDSWDLGTGAVDDAAGVGIIVAAAKLLLDTLEHPPRRTVRIVLFGAEEVGLVGARAYAERHAASLGQHIVATESDFGAGDIWRFDTRFAEAALPVGDAIGRILAPLGIERGGNKASGGPDMKYVREAGVPVVGLLQDGSDYFDLHHTPDDTLDKIGVNALHQNVAAYAAFVYLAAELDVDFR
ncbi:MAG: M28 family metallopeptidase [Halioglobus sp.]